jgi:hypothetical protein
MCVFTLRVKKMELPLDFRVEVSVELLDPYVLHFGLLL